MTDDQAVPLPADAITAAATKAYFAATEDGGFDHQRDAYEQGYADGAGQAAAAEREAIAQLADELEATVPQARRNGVVILRHPFADLIRARTGP